MDKIVEALENCIFWIDGGKPLMAKQHINTILPALRSGEVGIWTREEIELMRQWFDSVQDVNPQFLEQKDYDLAVKVYKATGMRVPNSILQRREEEDNG